MDVGSLIQRNMAKVILVTGAAGFIGSHLCEKLLAEGYRVIGIDNFDPFYPKKYKEQNITKCLQHPLFRLISKDAGDPAVLYEINETIDAVIHLAAKAGVQPSLKNPKQYIDSNISVTNNVLEWMRTKGMKKLIFASSSSVYGNSLQTPFHEKQSTDTAFSPYAFTKKACEVMNYTYHSLFDIDVINLRFFTVYGERQRPDLAIHKFVANILAGKPIYMYGDGSSARDYTYYADTVSGIFAALQYIFNHVKVYEIINLGNSKPIQLIELIQTIASVTGVEPIIIQDIDKPGDVAITYAAVDHAKELLDYQPTTTMQDGITNFVAWYKTNTYLNQ